MPSSYPRAIGVVSQTKKEVAEFVESKRRRRRESIISFIRNVQGP
jgi:hypothetical protein